MVSVGKKYLTKKGLEVRIIGLTEHRRFPFIGRLKSGVKLSYDECGMFSYNSSNLDLMERSK